MQRLGGDFLVKRVVMYHLENGNIVELYELPNGQWQFGKGRDAVVVTTMEQVEQLDGATKASVAAWLERLKHLPTPLPVQQGQTPLLAGDTARDQLSRAIAKMSDEVVARLLNAVVQTLGPVADSILQGEQINSHSDGFGQDGRHYAPGSVTSQPFQLPPGARWCDETRPASGYVTFPEGVTDPLEKQVSVWHPTPEFHLVTQQPDPVPIAETAHTEQQFGLDRELEQERAKREPEAVGAGAERPTSRRRH